MGKTRSAHPPEFRRQIIELVRAGLAPEELAREPEPTALSIRNWVAQSARDAGRNDGGLMTAEVKKSIDCGARIASSSFSGRWREALNAIILHAIALSEIGIS